MTDIDVYAKDIMDPDVYERYMRDDPRDHAPGWHQLGMRGHLNATILAADYIGSLVGVSIRTHALYHDVGKIRQFASAVFRVHRGLSPAPAFRNHERASADIALLDGLSREVSVPVAYHGLVYQNVRNDTLFGHLGDDMGLVRTWLAICASDTVAKGFTESRPNREPVALVLQRVGEGAGFGGEKWLGEIVAAARSMRLEDIPGYQA